MKAAFWLLVVPVGIAVMTVIFARGQHSAPHAQPQPFSCASLAKTIAVLDSGGQIAPLCNQVPYPEVTP